MSSNLEIERKFLVDGIYKKLAFEKSRMQQGYLSTDKERTVRIRVVDNSAYLTIKGSSTNNGLSRYEWEKEINFLEGLELLALCKKPIIEKCRYKIKHGKHIIEVDEFFGDNEGLTLAEIELAHENEVLDLPDFLGKEVTGNVKYYNSYLSQHPYSTWN